jgi:hypothetical protein
VNVRHAFLTKRVSAKDSRGTVFFIKSRIESVATHFNDEQQTNFQTLHRRSLLRDACLTEKHIILYRTERSTIEDSLASPISMNIVTSPSSNSCPIHTDKKLLEIFCLWLLVLFKERERERESNIES